MKKRKSAISLISSLTLLVILSPFVAIILKAFADARIFEGIWFTILDAIPFANVVAQLAIRIFTTIVPEVTDVQKYLAGVQEISSAMLFFQEFCKLCLTAVLYGVLKKLVDKWMEMGEHPKGLAFLQQVLWYMVSAFVSAVVAGIILNFAFDQINQLSGIGSKIFTNIIMFIILNGAVYIYVLIFAISIGHAIGYAIVKLVLVNIVGMFVSDVFLTFIILNLSEQTWGLFFAGISGWLIIIIALLGIDLMLESVFK